MHFRQKLKIFLKFDFVFFEDIDLGSPKLHFIEIFNQTTSNNKLVILALAGGSFCPLPIPSMVPSMAPWNQ